MDLPYKTGEKTSSKSEEVNAEETLNTVSLSTSSAGEEQRALGEPETPSSPHVVKVLEHHHLYSYYPYCICAACIQYTHCLLHLAKYAVYLQLFI